MQRRIISAALAGLSLLLIHNGVSPQSKVEYAEQRADAWRQAESSLNEAYAVLLKQAENEPNQVPAQQLRDAKEKWEAFRDLFCRSVGSTYGGMWAGIRDTECSTKLAEDFRKHMEGYGW